MSSRAPGFQYSLVSESLKEITDFDICPFGNIALSLKENLTVFVPTTFLFQELRVSGVVGSGCGSGWSGMGALRLIPQASGCVGDVSSWMVTTVVESAKRTFFLCGGPQFESSSSIGRIHDLIGIAAGSNKIDIDDCERKKVDNTDAKDLTDSTLLDELTNFTFRQSFLTSSEVDYGIEMNRDDCEKTERRLTKLMRKN